MCTLTWFREFGRYELFFNRDERLTRKPALPPQLSRTGGVGFVAPRDGDFGGTWIGANEYGVAVCLLNGYADADRPRPADEFTSRGLLLMSLMDCRSSLDVSERLSATDLTRYRAFLLASFETEREGLMFDWQRGSLSSEPIARSRIPVVSSSFATDAVRRSRSEQFDSAVRHAGAGIRERHLAYHRSHEPSRGAYSTCMHREDAQTVSFSHVEVGTEAVRFHYVPDSACQDRGDRTTVVLPRRLPARPGPE